MSKPVSWALAIAGIVIVSFFAAQRDFYGPSSMLLGIINAILLYRILNSLEKGLDEIRRNNRAVNAPAPNPLIPSSPQS